MDFTGFLGNDAVKARLSGAFASGRVAHSYLLCGPAGSGKHTLTRILSAAMQCEGRSGKIPCGVCSGCRKALEGVHPDIITVDDPDHKAMTVDPIRAARSDMFIRPNEGKRKIYIIPRGQDMNESAQNALLKILEEPPDYGVFLILSTNAERLPPTNPRPPGVRAPDAQHRMQTRIRKTRADAREFQRGFEQSFAQAVTVFVPITQFSILQERNRIIGFASMLETRAPNRPKADIRAVDIFLVVNYRKIILGL